MAAKRLRAVRIAIDIRSRIAKATIEKLGYKDVVNLGSLEDAAKTLKRKIIK